MDDRELAQRLDTLEQLLTAVYAKLYPEQVQKEPEQQDVKPELRPQFRKR